MRPFHVDRNAMRSEEAPTKPNLRRPPGEAFPEEPKTKPAGAPLRTARERAEFDFSRDPRHDPE